jgi:hypothetical protein
MNSKDSYLHITAKSLLLRYGLLYIAFAMSIVFSKHSAFWFSVWYWLIFVTVIFIESAGSGLKIENNSIIWRSWFFFKLIIPLDNVTSLEKGEFYGVGRPECIILKFEHKKGAENTAYILPHLYNRGDIINFIEEMKRIKPNLRIDPPHESPHFCATLKSPSLGFPRAAGWRIIREGELCARRRNDLISFMNS